MNIKLKLNKKGGISLAWDHLGYFLLAILGLIVVLIIVFGFASSGSSYLDILGGLFS